MMSSTNVDPYEVLQLPRNFSLDQLKSQYKKMALSLHPDKNSFETNSEFNMLTFCYKHLLQEYKDRHSAFHHEIKNQSKDFIQTQESDFGGQSTRKPKFNIENFNRHFDSNRIRDVNDAGYEKWMKQNDPDVKPSCVKENFIVHYKEPESAYCSKLDYAELGQGKISDFTGTNDTLKKLNYMDYRVAHTIEKIIDPDKVQLRREYKDINDLENDRQVVTMDEQSYQQHLQQQLDAQVQENLRLERLRKRDNIIAAHSEKMQRLFLS